MRAFVQSQPEFDAWVLQQQAPAAEPSETEAARGAQVFQQRGCLGCHTISGAPPQTARAPDLRHFASRQTLAAGIMERSDANIRRWLHDPPGVKPGATMPNLNLSDEELDALVAYLQSLK